MAGYNTGLHGIQYMAREQFDSTEMTKVPVTLYVVDNGENFSLYLGELPLLSDGGAPNVPVGTMTREYTIAESRTAGTMEWAKQTITEVE